MTELEAAVVCIVIIGIKHSFWKNKTNEERLIKLAKFDSLAVALGIAYYFDNGFFNIFMDMLLGWVYIAYKATQFIVSWSGVIL